MRKRGLLVLTLALLVLGLMGVMFLSACGEEETTTTAAPASSETTAPASTETTAPASTETTAATGEAGEDLVIGSINSLTGSNVLTGQEEKWAQEKAVADINAKGGIKLADGKMHKLVLKYVDDKSQPTEGAAAMEKLIKTDGIKIVLSSNITPVNQAAATVAEQYEAYFHIVSSWTDEASPDGSFPGFIGGMDLKWSTDMFESAADSGLVAVGGAKAHGIRLISQELGRHDREHAGRRRFRRRHQGGARGGRAGTSCRTRSSSRATRTSPRSS